MIVRYWARTLWRRRKWSRESGGLFGRREGYLVVVAYVRARGWRARIGLLASTTVDGGLGIGLYRWTQLHLT